MAKFGRETSCHIAIIGLILALAIPAPGCRRPEGELSVAGNWYDQERLLYYGIPVRVAFYPKDEALAKLIWTYLNRVDDVFNDYRADSEIGKINRMTRRERVPLSGELAVAFRKSLSLCDITGGAFDITIRPLLDLWKTAAKRGSPPTRTEIDRVLRDCGCGKIEIDDEALSSVTPGMSFDFGGIVKGIAIDHVIADLRRHHVESALISIGGEIGVFGLSTRNRPHVLGIQHPIHMNRLWTAVNDPGNGLSLSTSGNYRNPIMIGDRSYYHIIDPTTGYPVSERILSASVAFPRTGRNWLADGLSTASVVMGTKRSSSIIEKLGGEVLFLVGDESGISEIKSSGWDRLRE